MSTHDSLWDMFDEHAHLSTLADAYNVLMRVIYSHFFNWLLMTTCVASTQGWCIQLVLLMVMHLGYLETSWVVMTRYAGCGHLPHVVVLLCMFT
jgi:hypothetical protein